MYSYIYYSYTAWCINLAPPSTAQTVIITNNLWILAAEFQTSTALLNVFYSFILFYRHIAKIVAKAKVFHMFFCEYWFSGTLLLKKILIASEWAFHQYFFPVLNNFCVILPELQKIAVFGGNCQSCCRKTKLCPCFYLK